MMIQPGAIYTIWLRELIRFSRSKSRVVGSLSMPVLWLIMLGTGLNSAISLGGSIQYINYLGPGILGMSLLFTSIFAGVSVIWDRQFGFLKEILVAPVSRTSIVLGKIAGSATISMINGMIMLVLAILIGAISASAATPLNILLALAMMATTSAVFVSIGLAIAARMTNMEGFQLIMNFLVMPLFFLSGAVFPMDKAPVWMKAIMQFDPLMYGVDGLRGIFLGSSGAVFPLSYDMGVMAISCVFMVIFSAYLFRDMKAT